MGVNQWGYVLLLDVVVDVLMMLYLFILIDGDGIWYWFSQMFLVVGIFFSQQVDFVDCSICQGVYYFSLIVCDVFEFGFGLVFVSVFFVQLVDIVGMFFGVLNLCINKCDVDLSVVLYEQLVDGCLMQLFYFVG